MQRQKLITVLPAIESLLAENGLKSLWPTEIKKNPVAVMHSEMRRNLLLKLGELFKQIPTTTNIAEAVDSREINIKLVSETYELLANFLNIDPHHKRIVLYLPFELLPNKTWVPPPDLVRPVDFFIHAYMTCWRELLKEISVRANFSNGNILEPELSPNGQIMVCKAAHLIPQLVDKGFISTKTVVSILDESQNEILKSSIADVIPILADMSFLTLSECEQILISRGFPFDQAKERLVISPPKKESPLEWLKNLAANSVFELEKIEMRTAIDKSRRVPVGRVLWEKQEKEDALAQNFSIPSHEVPL